MARSVVVVATSDKPALIRNKAAKVTANVEYFQRSGKDVLMMDSLTRFSMAQREIGLAWVNQLFQRISAQCVFRNAKAA